MITGNERVGSSRNTAMVLRLLGAALLMIAPIGHVGVGGKEHGSTSMSKKGDEGERLFRSETFGGNGRTCETCHSKKHRDALPG